MRLVLIVACAALTACASPYQQRGLGGGFDETQLDVNVWRVSFRGNGYTKGDRAEDLALLRSADLALMNGFKFFVLSDARTQSSVSSYTAPIVANTTTSAYGVGNQAYANSVTRFSGGGTTFVSRPSAVNTVIIFKEKPDLNAMIFDVAFICQSLGKKYEVVCGVVK